MQLPAEVLGATLRRGVVPPSLPGAVVFNEWVQATPDTVRYDIGGVRLLVLGADEVVLDAPADADPAVVAPLLYGAAARAVLLHRGTFTLHASLVVVDGRSLVIGGASGAGKSTTAVALAARPGGRLVIDDVVPVDIIDGHPVTVPFVRPVHLTPEARDRSGHAETAGSPVGQGEGIKAALDLAEPDGPVPIERLVVVSHNESGGGPPVRLTPVHGGERLRRVVRLSNATGLASMGARGGPFFTWSTALASALEVHDLERRPEIDTLDEVCALLTEGELLGR